MQIRNSFKERNILERIDVFGIDISIRFCSQVLHKTTTGGVITIIIFGYLFFQSVLIVKQLFDYQNPLVIYQQSFTNKPQKFDLTADIFSFAFGLQFSNSTHFIDPEVYKVSLQMRTTQKILNSTSNTYYGKNVNRNLELEICTPQHFQNQQTKNYFLMLDYSKLYCISLKEQGIYIEGQFDSNIYSRLQLTVEICSNSNNNGKICKPLEYINSVLYNNRFAAYYNDNAVVTRDRYNPFQSIGKQSFFVSSPTLSKTLTLSFKNSYLYTDIGIMIEDIQISRTLSFSSDREQTTTISGGKLFDCYIALEKNVQSEYHRSYPKLDKALSQLGGIYNILFSIGCLLCKPISQVELNKKLLSSLFSLVSAEEDDESQSPRKNNQDNQSLSGFQPHDINLNKNLNNQKGINSNILQNQSEIIRDRQQSNKTTTELAISNRKKQISNQKQELSNFQMEKRTSIITPIKSIENDELFSQSPKKEIQLPNSALVLTAQKSTERQDPEISSQKKEVTKKRSNIFNLFKKKNSTTQNNQVQQNIQAIQKIFNYAIKEITFKTYEYFISTYNIFKCCRRKKHQVLKQGIAKLYQHIDIFYITTKLIEFEKLKSLLLNEQQLKMFEFIPRPKLKFSNNEYLDVQSYNQKLLDKQDDWVEKTVQAQQALNQIISKGSQISHIDKRLIEILHPRFKGINLNQIRQEDQITNLPNDQVISMQEMNDINDFDNDRNQVRPCIPIQEKDFKNDFFSDEQMLGKKFFNIK